MKSKHSRTYSVSWGGVCILQVLLFFLGEGTTTGATATHKCAVFSKKEGTGPLVLVSVTDAVDGQCDSPLSTEQEQQLPLCLLFFLTVATNLSSSIFYIHLLISFSPISPSLIYSLPTASNPVRGCGVVFAFPVPREHSGLPPFFLFFVWCLSFLIFI